MKAARSVTGDDLHAYADGHGHFYTHANRDAYMYARPTLV